MQWQRETSRTLPTFCFLHPPRPPSFIDVGDPNLFVFPAQFPFFFWVSFLWHSVFGCEVCTPFPSHPFFLFVPPMRQLNLSYSVNLSCSFTAFLFAAAYPFLFAFPLFANSRRSRFHPPFSHSHPTLPLPSLGSTHPSLPFPW